MSDMVLVHKMETLPKVNEWAREIYNGILQTIA